MADFLGTAERFLPAFLNPQKKEALLKELRAFEQAQYYLPPAAIPDPILQGDGWAGLVAIRFETGERKLTEGLIISNSCDISQQNERVLSPRLIFAPLIKVDRFSQRLVERGISGESVAARIDSLRRQHTTSAFFLPQQPYGPGADSLVLFDDLHAIPSTEVGTDRDSLRFRLSQVGFWLLLVKLSIHFCRMNEGIDRSTRT